MKGITIEHQSSFCVANTLVARFVYRFFFYQTDDIVAFYFISGGAYGWRETTEFSRVNRERQIKWCRW
jgi:hypothetical protein